MDDFDWSGITSWDGLAAPVDWGLSDLSSSLPPDLYTFGGYGDFDGYGTGQAFDNMSGFLQDNPYGPSEINFMDPNGPSLMDFATGGTSYLSGAPSLGGGSAVSSAIKSLLGADGKGSGLNLLKDLLGTAATQNALWNSGPKVGPASIQGTKGATPWSVGRMPIRAADGGSVLQKLRELYEQYGPGANRTERPRGPDRADPRQLMIDNGMVQNASRAMTGRQRQLDELERQAVQGMAMGGAVFPSTVSPRLVKHASGGQSDKVPIAASGGEYVMDADSVAALGDGNTDAGSAVLDEMRQNLRKHKRSAPPNKIPPKAKSPLAYMKGKVS